MNNPTTNHPTSPAPVKADHYQPLRDAVATSSMPVGPTTFPRILELLGDLLKERDALRVLLRRAGDELCCCGDLMAEADDEAVDENDWRDSHFCPHCDDSVDRTWEVRHAIRAALADGEEA